MFLHQVINVPLTIMEWSFGTLSLIMITNNAIWCIYPNLALREWQNNQILPTQLSSPDFPLHRRRPLRNWVSGRGGKKTILVVNIFHWGQSTLGDKSLAINHDKIYTIHPHWNTHHNSLHIFPSTSKGSGIYGTCQSITGQNNCHCLPVPKNL